jgi:hypothetical protein
MGVFGGQKGVVEIELAHGDAVGPGGPFRRIGAVDPKSLGAAGDWTGLRLPARHSDGPAQDGRGADGGVVDDPVCHHLHGVRLHGYRIGGDFGDLGGQVFGAREVLEAAPRPNDMHLHGQRLCRDPASKSCAAPEYARCRPRQMQYGGT